MIDIHINKSHRKFMSEYEPITRLIDATTSYLPISHSKSALDKLDYKDFGLLHTGQLRDVTIGSYLTNDNYGAPQFVKSRSKRFIHKLPNDTLDGYDNLELFLYLNRGFLYILTGNVPVQQYTEAISPFLDVDLLDFCMSIPLKYRINHSLCKKWNIRKYTGAGEYIWERLGSRITAPNHNNQEKNHDIL